MIEQVITPSANPDLPDDAPHVLLALDQFSATLGGGERVALRLAALLPDYGFRASILTLSLHPQSPVLNNPPPCPVFLLPLDRTWDGTALRSALALRRFLKERQIRLVQTFFESSDLWVGAVVKSAPDVGLIWSRRDMGILRTAKHRIAYRLLARMPDQVFAVSDQVRRHCIEEDGVPPERVTTIYNGVHTDPAKPTDQTHTRDDARPVVLSVGNIRYVKGHDVLLEAAALVLKRFPDVTFAIAGAVIEADYFATLQARAAELGMEEHFRFLGGDAALEEEFSRAVLFVMPSRSEGFSNAIVEAMMASLPVVATAVGGNGEAVVDGMTGLLVPSEDARALGQAVCEMLADVLRAEQMGVAGRDRALRHFTESSMMESTVSAYRRVLHRP